MDEALGRKPCIMPPVTTDYNQGVMVVSPPSPREPQAEAENPSKRKGKPEWVQILNKEKFYVTA